VPTKILAYLASGRPVICATAGASAELVRTAGAGLVCPPGDPKSLAAAIAELASLPEDARAALGERGRSYLQAHFEQQRVIDGYERLLDELAHVRSRDRRGT
jgi:colanic acid biosynthesis glycosyl transferase WcaI